MFDSQTTVILAALVFGMLPALIQWIAPSAASEPATRWWQLGSVVAAVSLALLGFRESLPLWLGNHLANSGLMMSFLFWAQSLRTSLDSAWKSSHVAWACLAALGWYELSFAALEIGVRIPVNRVVMGGLALYVALLARRLSQRERSHNAGAIMACYLFLGVGLCVSAWLVTRAPMTFSPQGILVKIPGSPALLSLLTATVGNFCYLGVLLERSARVRRQAVHEQVRVDESAHLDSKLQLLDRQRRLVLAAGSLAHELNQPLTAALTQAQLARRMLGSAKISTEGMRDLLDKAAFNVWRTSEILGRIRQANRAKAIGAARLDLREVVQTSLSLMEAEWRSLGIRVEARIGAEPLWCRGDEVGLSQVLVNLLRNAAQAMGQTPGGVVQVEAGPSGDEVRIAVRDSGPGFEEDVLAHWGQPFTDRSAQGLGLGLAISREIMQQHQGRLSAHNLAQGGAEVEMALSRDKSS